MNFAPPSNLDDDLLPNVNKFASGAMGMLRWFRRNIQPILLTLGVAGFGGGAWYGNKRIDEVDAKARSAVADTLRAIVKDEIAPVRNDVSYMRGVMRESDEMKRAAARYERRLARDREDSAEEANAFRYRGGYRDAHRDPAEVPDVAGPNYRVPGGYGRN